jgi:dihydrofolate synthase/folylpolyglutamate synthase
MSANQYQDVLRWLYGLEAARGMDFKLERVALALKNLGNPHKQYPCIHVAGTNGKGSISAMMHEVLGAAGYRSGLYVSPHLVSFTERMRMGDALVAEDDVVRLAGEVRSLATGRGIELTFFEFVTVMAFLYFARQEADIAVVEVGLGGRLDATNVIHPIVTVISSIDFDHEEYLGSTIESITAEKCGIIKRGTPVVVGRVNDAARAVIEATAKARRARVFWSGHDFELVGADSCFSGFGRRLGGVQPALLGRFQVDNAAVAIAALLQLEDGFTIPDDAIRRGLADVRWPGRLEVVRGRPTVVIDGAHNLGGIRILVAELPHIAAGRSIHLLFGVMRDKTWEPMLRELAPYAKSVVVTAALPPRGEAPELLAAALPSNLPVTIIRDPGEAFEWLLSHVAGDDVILVTGSLFLVGQIYPLFSRWRERVDEHAMVV